jgi:hypothetical protein
MSCPWCLGREPGIARSSPTSPRRPRAITIASRRLASPGTRPLSQRPPPGSVRTVSSSAHPVREGAVRRWLTLWLGIVLGILGLLPVAVAAATGTAKWSTTSLPNPPLRQGQLTGISCTSTSACVGSGFFQSASGNIAPMAEALTKSGWSAAAAPAPGGSVFAQLLAISCHGTDCEAVGMSSSSSGKISALAERWNGSSWSTQSVPSPKGPRRRR